MRVVCEACAAPVEEGRFLCAACLENFDKAKWAYSCRAKFEALIEPLRAIARSKGYALAVHGSLARDIDLLAVPWTDDAATADALVEVLLAEIQRVNGHVYIRDRDENPARKPHGRLAWSIHLGGGPYIDLSVMPTIEPGQIVVPPRTIERPPFSVDPSEREHDSSFECWCRPYPTCGECGAQASCIHGSDRPEVFVHRRDS